MDALERIRVLLSGKKVIRPFCKQTGLSYETLRKWKIGTIPGADSLELFCKGADISANWLLLGIGPENLSECTAFRPKTKVIKIDTGHRFLRLVEEWMNTLDRDDQDEVAGLIRRAIRKEYDDFQDWLKKRDELEECGTSPGCKSEVNG